jgi:glycosyltransferase involved in cell wall biosynthesis
VSAGLKVPACHLLMTVDVVGGVWRYALDLVTRYAGSGMATTLAILGPSPSPEQRREAAAIADLTIVDTALPLDWMCCGETDVDKAAAVIAALARDSNAGIVQLNGSPLAGKTAFSVPVIAVHHSCLSTWWASVKHGSLPAEWCWHREVVQRHLAAADVVVAPSAAFAGLISSVYDHAIAPVIVRNGRAAATVPLINFAAAPGIFTAGRLWDEAKDIITLDRAAKRLATPVFAAGPTRGPNGAQVKCENVQLIGTLGEAEMRGWLARRPIFVSTAVYEPFGLAVLEAAQAGCALVLADIPTFRELWQDAALFVAVRDEIAVSDTVTRLLRDSSLRQALGEAARQRARFYDLDTAAAAMAALYFDLVAGSKRSEAAA